MKQALLMSLLSHLAASCLTTKSCTIMRPPGGGPVSVADAVTSCTCAICSPLTYVYSPGGVTWIAAHNNLATGLSYTTGATITSLLGATSTIGLQITYLGNLLGSATITAVYCDDVGDCGTATTANTCSETCNSNSIQTNYLNAVTVSRLGDQTSSASEWTITPTSCGPLSAYTFELIQWPGSISQNDAMNYFTTSVDNGLIKIRARPPSNAPLGQWYFWKVKVSRQADSAHFKEQTVDFTVTACKPGNLYNAATISYTIGDDYQAIISLDSTAFTQSPSCYTTFKLSVINPDSSIITVVQDSSYSKADISIQTNDRTKVSPSPLTIRVTTQTSEEPTYSFFQDFTLNLIDPCLSTNLSPTQTLQNMEITALRVLTTTQQVEPVKDSASLQYGDKGGYNFCPDRSYTIQSTTVPTLPAGTLLIDHNGLITVDASAVGHAYLGQHIVKVKVEFSTSRFCELTFTLKILNCVVTDLSLTMPFLQDQFYTIGDPKKDWYYDQTFAIMAPLCPYHLSLTYENLPTFVQTTDDQTTETTYQLTAESFLRTDATDGEVQVIAKVREQLSFPSIQDSFRFTVIDPCITTVISQHVISKELIAFQGYSASSVEKLAFTDSTSVNFVSVNSAYPNFCGAKLTTYYCNSTETQVLTGKNSEYITFSPTLSTKPGKAYCTLKVTMEEVDGISRAIDFTATTMGYVVTPIQDQIYYVGSLLLIPYSKFEIYPKDYFQTAEYRLYVIDDPSKVQTPLDLDLLEEASSSYFELDQVKQQIKLYNNNFQIPIPLFHVVLVGFIEDSAALLYTSFKVTLQEKLAFDPGNKPPEWISSFTKKFVVNQCQAKPTTDWSYKLPGLQDMEADQILEPKVLIYGEAIRYDSLLRQFKQVSFVETPQNVTVEVYLEDSRGAKQKHDFLVQFMCITNSTEQEMSAQERAYQLIARQDYWPTAKIIKIQPDGRMSIRFDKLMVVPSDETGLDLQNATITLNETLYPALEIQVIPGPYSRGELLIMNWTYLNYTSTQLEVQLNFDQPTIVSSIRDSKDMIKVTIYGFPWFQDLQGNYINPGYQLNPYVLPQLNKNEQLKTASQQGLIALAVTTSIFSASTLINLLISGPLKHLLDTVKSTQILLHLLLIDVSTPATASVFFAGLMALLTFQLIDLSSFYDRLFSLSDVEPLTNQFETLGYSSLYVIQNLGLMIFTIVIPFIVGFVLHILTKISANKKLALYKQKLFEMLFFNKTLQFINETYLILLMGAALNVHYLYWDTPGNITNSLLAVVILAVVLTFPVLVGVLYSNKKSLSLIRDRERSGLNFMNHFGSVIRPYNTHRRGAKVVSYLYFGMLRKIWLVYIIVFMQKDVIRSLIMVNFQAVMMAVVIGQVKPFHDQHENDSELLNEFTTLIVNYHLMLFTEYVPDTQTREYIGKSLTIVVVGNLALNLCLNFLRSLKLMFARLKLRYARWRQSKQAKKVQKTKDQRKKYSFQEQAASIERQLEEQAQLDIVEEALSSLSSLSEYQQPQLLDSAPHHIAIKTVQIPSNTVHNHNVEIEDPLGYAMGYNDPVPGLPQNPVWVPYDYKVLLDANNFEALDKQIKGLFIPKALRNHIEQKRVLYQQSIQIIQLNTEQPMLQDDDELQDEYHFDANVNQLQLRRKHF